MLLTEKKESTLFEMPKTQINQDGGKTNAEPRLKKINRDQFILRPMNIEELVPADHEVRAIWELVGQMELSRYYKYIRSVEGKAGRDAHDPRLMICLWVYAYKEGICSGREITRLCDYHPGFQWLTAMTPINYHTMSDFRVNNKEALDELFAELLGMLSSEGLISLERVMHDGTKIKAQAGGDSFRRENRLKSHLEMARQHVESMGDPDETTEVNLRVKAAQERAAREKKEKLELALEELKKIRAAKQRKADEVNARASETDPEARIMKQGYGGYAPSYNAQISTDSQAGAIVGVGLSQSPSDASELIPAVERIEKNMGRPANEMVVDGGFTNRPNIMEMEKKKIDLVGSLIDRSQHANAWGTDLTFRLDAFRYEEQQDQYWCPAGKVLGLKRVSHGIGAQDYQYRAEVSDCRVCPFKEKCCPKSVRYGRTVSRVVEDPVVISFREKMETKEAKETYKLRGPIAEFPNAWIKDKMGLRQFSVRGRIKAEMEVTWACLAYNIQLWMRLIWKPRRILVST